MDYGYILVYLVKKGTKGGRVKQARTEISARVAIDAPPVRINWPAKLELLRDDDYYGEDAAANVARLLDGCGYAPPQAARRVMKWRVEHIDPQTMERVRVLQRTVLALDDEGVKAVHKAWAHCTRQAKLLAQPRPKTGSHGFNIGELERRMESYLQVASAARRSGESDAKYLSALFKAVASAARKSGEPFAQVMQRIKPGTPLKTMEPKPYPDAVLRHLLNFAVNDKLATTLSFGKDGLPVVLITALDPVAALLLRAHEAMTLEVVHWGTCEQCGKQFIKGRKDKLTCSDRCKENRKKSRQRH
jgi:hypothetical protein